MKLQRAKRKQIKFSDAMELLDMSRTTLRRKILERNLQLAPRRGSNTSPNYLYEAEVKEYARELGLIV